MAKVFFEVPFAVVRFALVEAVFAGAAVTAALSTCVFCCETCSFLFKVWGFTSAASAIAADILPFAKLDLLQAPFDNPSRFEKRHSEWLHSSLQFLFFFCKFSNSQ
ncbi:hypothetical protein BJ741DRAFT_619540 [Chytriomyces cf. hyalinus JEL632]|nr:hypothetical protein BJ741DRAFT_619540 [Chytriomyces cf. hyalinus JEL632]